MLNGVDISDYQSAIPAGAQFVLVKATEGVTLNDARFAEWWKALRSTPRGVYHFAHPNLNAPLDEAKHFLAVIEAAGGYRPGDKLILDHETAGSSPQHDSDWALQWCKYVQDQTGIVPTVYTYRSFATEGHCAGLQVYPLWIADPDHPAGHPEVPKPWTSWLIHQYSETGGIDHDVFNGSLNDWGHVIVRPVAPFPLVREGATGATVKRIQTALIKAGFSVGRSGADGIFGPATLAAVKAFQQAKHLSVDGIVGPLTARALGLT